MENFLCYVPGTILKACVQRSSRSRIWEIAREAQWGPVAGRVNRGGRKLCFKSCK